jgi:hypothetical protein
MAFAIMRKRLRRRPRLHNRQNGRTTMETRKMSRRPMMVLVEMPVVETAVAMLEEEMAAVTLQVAMEVTTQTTFGVLRAVARRRRRKRRTLGELRFFAILACEFCKVGIFRSAPHTNLSPGRKPKKTRRRRRERKRKKQPPPLLPLMFQQIHQLLIRWTTNGEVSPLQARRRRARRANSPSLSLCQNQNPNRLLNRSLNRSLHLLPRPQQTTCGDFLRPARRRRARKARSVTSLLFMYLASGVSRIGVSPPDGVIIRAAPRVSGQGWVA